MIDTPKPSRAHHHEPLGRKPKTASTQRKIHWQQMHIGDAFLILLQPDENASDVDDKLRRWVVNAHRVQGYHFQVRRIPEGWRIVRDR